MTTYIQYDDRNEIWPGSTQFPSADTRPIWWHLRSAQVDTFSGGGAPGAEGSAIDFDIPQMVVTTYTGGIGSHLDPQGDGIFRIRGSGLFSIHLEAYVDTKEQELDVYIFGGYKATIHAPGGGCINYRTVSQKTSSQDGQIRIIAPDGFVRYAQTYLSIYKIQN